MQASLSQRRRPGQVMKLPRLQQVVKLLRAWRGGVSARGSWACAERGRPGQVVKLPRPKQVVKLLRARRGEAWSVRSGEE